MAKVSVVIPVCNVEKYVRKCIESVLNQTMEDIQIVCVDDCSEDDSAEILREYARKDSRMTCIFHETNLGTSQARKDGVKATIGEYVMFLDGDDQLSSDACEKAYDAIKKYQTDMVQFDTQVVNCAGMPEGRIESNQRALYPCMEKIEAENLISTCWTERRFGFTLWNKIYKGDICRRAFECVENGYYPKAQDLYAFFIIAYFSKSYMGIEGRFYNYNFGLGVTGGDGITLKKYDILLTEKRVWEAMTRFIKSKGQMEFYGEILNGIRDHFLEECVNRWKNNLDPEYLSDGFKHLVDVWGLEDVLVKLAEKSWFDRYKVAEKMLDVDYFHYRKRPVGKKKTIAAYYRTISNGGAQRVVTFLCNKWAELRDENGEYLYNVVLITDEPAGKNDYPLNNRVKREIIAHHQKVVREKYRERFGDWNRILTEHQVDVVVSSMWLSPCTLWDMLTVKGHERKPAFIIHSHSFCGMPYRNPGSMALELTFDYQICDGVVCLSDCDERFASVFSNHARFILNPLTFGPEDFEPYHCEKNAIVWVGRISEEKNPMEAIQMMRMIVQEIPDAKLYMVGDGNETLVEQLREAIVRLGLETNVILTGFTDNVGEYYKKAAVYICTSEYEGFSLSYCEAMAYSVPIVSYDLPWLNFVRDGRGVITVPHRRFDRLAKAVMGLLKDQERCAKLGQEGQQQVRELASVDIGKEWQTFLTEIDFEKKNAHRERVVEDVLFEYITRYQEVGKGAARRNVKNADLKVVSELEKRIKKLEKRNKELENSTTYKVGRVMMKLPIRMKKAVRKMIRNESGK